MRKQVTARDTQRYDDMSRDVEAGDYSVAGPVQMGAQLRMGRPAKGSPTAGKTPSLPVRLPDSIRAETAKRVTAGEATSEAELVRRALIEYFDNHPHQ